MTFSTDEEAQAFARSWAPDLLSAVVKGATEGDFHMLTVSTWDGEWTTELTSTPQGLESTEAACGEVLALILKAGDEAALVVRTLHSKPHIFEDGSTIEAYTVRGWRIDGGAFHGLGFEDCFTAFCTDATTGEPIPPEAGTSYAGAYPIILLVEGELA